MEYEEAPIVEASSVVSFAIDYLWLKQRNFGLVENKSYGNGCERLYIQNNEKLFSV